MYHRIIKVKRVHGVGSGEEGEIVIANEHLHANGVFSNVYRTQLLLPTQQQVAIKKVWIAKAGAEAVAQEIDLLKRLDHPHIVSLLYYFRLKADDEVCECLVFDFLPTDLSKLRMQLPSRRFDPLDAKLYAWQMFSAIDYVNACGIIHFDLKPSNMIVDDRFGLLKLADFGNAKTLKRYQKLNPYQVTRYYRAPELVFGTNEFTTSIDRWAAGCVLAELILGKPLLAGRDSIDQGRIIVEVLGYPTVEQCKAMSVSRPRMSRKTARGFGPLIANSDFPEKALDIVKRTLIYEPQSRMQTQFILAHPYFDELRVIPAPRRSNDLPIPPLNYQSIEQKTQSDRSAPVMSARSENTFTTTKPTDEAKSPVSTPNTKIDYNIPRWWFW